MKRVHIALASAAVLLAPVVLAGCSPAASAESATCPNGQITFGIEPFEDPKKLEPAYKTVAESLSKTLDCPVEVQVLEDYSAEVLAMQNGKLDIGQFGPLGYVFASERAGAEPLASFGTAEGELSSYTGGIWVPKESGITTLEDLRGKDLALGSVGSTSGDALPRYALAQAGIAESELNLNYAGGHPEALLALTNKTVDAAQINSQTMGTAIKEGTFKKEDFRQIWESDPIPNDPITVAESADPEFKKAVKDALLNLPAKDIEEVAGYLGVEPAGQLIEVDKSTYQPLFDLAKTMNLTEEDV
ncbi:phosphate/phosphite/phosphonate ABC transporter substrate-binding protein [Brevibacterium casei]|uniref:Phosphate-binding protein of phosphonate ABC transporter PhnD n=2 Tax=Brevibacterium casei TaxID=33889 RepID=K9AMP8_9MICO|nr:phosphate/phosphite/phosphonate ABC transporter substrate-binding protein [Brevibacterium casei]EKU48678.1 phosphate-binding protein of phosphonate ABC transporter PhnD [Brevibacterium casei S18]KZE22236.1 phosphonate ABC transporter substrate-binding protein [Brevibacterium casei]MBE4693343.1 phosphate/phosphite/phosphonate ABC transporter substrate-binding protein [Brevibacterium casei]MBY3576466.1 phosphate/phosphite/phosphonate ABC transporter substrate-binding protein [Brevibacterium ca